MAITGELSDLSSFMDTEDSDKLLSFIKMIEDRLEII